MSEARHTVSVRGLPDWLIRDYLADMGATAEAPTRTATDPGAPEGAGGETMRAARWAVTRTSRRVAIAGSDSLTLTQHELAFSGDEEAVAEAMRVFLAKAQRGGG
jgi:hypothetical protein